MICSILNSLYYNFYYEIGIAQMRRASVVIVARKSISVKQVEDYRVLSTRVRQE